MRSFGSDNHAGAHEKVITALAKAGGHMPAYGGDELTAAASRLIRESFNVETDPLFVFNGTGANVLCLASMARTFEAVICPETAHINVDEATAPETVGHVKLLPCPHEDGKLTVRHAEKHLAAQGVVHHPQPKIISISNVSEYGTVYTPEETKALADFAHDHGMLLHVDGARLANAAASLGCSLADITFNAGVDAVSFGGTKNGMVFGEAALFKCPEHARTAAFQRKRLMQLGSKMRFIAAQFIAMMEGELWRETALHANAMAALLAGGISSVPGVRVTKPVAANAVFATLPEAVVAPLSTEYPFHVWDESITEARLMCAFDTTDDDVAGFVKRLRELVGA